MKSLRAALLLLSLPGYAFAQSAGTVSLPTGVGANTPASLSAAINAALGTKADYSGLTAEITRAEAAEVVATNSASAASTAATSAQTAAAAAVQLPTLPLNAILSQFPEPNATGTGLLERLLFNDTGSTATNPTLADSSGNSFTVNFAGNASLPTRNGDGSLTFNTNTPVSLPASVTGVHTMNFVVSNAIVLPAQIGAIPSPTVNSIVGWSSTPNGIDIGFSPAYAGSATGQGYGSQYIRGFGGGNNLGASYFGGPGIDNGLDFVSFVINGTTLTVYQNGLPLPAAASGTAYNALLTSGVVWTLGGNPGCGTPSNCQSKITYQYHDSSTVSYSAAQEMQQYHAEQAYMAYKGETSVGAYGPTNVQQMILSLVESVGSAHGLGNPPTNLFYGTENFSALAAVGLNTAYPSQNWTGIANGNDNATGYTELAPCPTELSAIGQNVSYKEAVLFEHGNAASVVNGTSPASTTNAFPNPPYSQTVAGQTMAVISNFEACMAKTNHTWHSIIATVIGNADVSQVDETAQQDTENPLIRTFGSQSFDAVWDPANDARFGILGAGTNQSLTGCTPPGGLAGPTYQTVDHLHPSYCGQQILSDQLQAVSAYLQQKNNPEVATVPATYSMALPDLAGILTVPGGGTLTLLPCGGLTNAKMGTFINSGSSAETIQAGTEYNAGAVDVIYSAAGVPSTTTPFTVPAGSSVTLKVTFPSGQDGTANSFCHINVAS